MPARSIYIAAPEGQTGKSLVALGLVDVLRRDVHRVGVFRPVTRAAPGRDPLLAVLLDRAGMPGGSWEGVTYEDVHADPTAALGTIVARYRAATRDCDAVVIVGSDYTDVASPTEFGFNAQVAANLGAPVLLVVSGFGRAPQEVAQVVAMAGAELADAHAQTVGVVVNRAAGAALDAVREEVSATAGLPCWAVPEQPVLMAPLVADLARALDGALVGGDEILLGREAESLLVCGMNVEHILDRLQDGQVCIAAGDRPDVLVALAAAHAADGFPTLAGIVLNGGFLPGAEVTRLMRGLDAHLPVILTAHDSYTTARLCAATRGQLFGSGRKIDLALGAFERHIGAGSLRDYLDVPRSEVVTPLMFEAGLLERAGEDRRHIVLPEGSDERILRAASTLLSRQVVDLTILGHEEQIREKAAALALDLGGAHLVDPDTSPLTAEFVAEYTRLRAHKGMTPEVAADVVRDVSYFGTLMVRLGHADGMVSGAAHSTAHTITPSFEIIKTSPGVEVASSVFFMCLDDRVLVYGDCAIVPEPTVIQLADIAISSAATAAQFGIDPRVAMLSYSTGTSGAGAEVDKVREATELVRRRRPDLLVDGPLQYDAAIDASVARTKMPESDVAGRATVFIFPDLNTGNNTYKAVQRSAGAVAIGPILQGLARPVNDLSRGATVRDIVNTIAITAIQAQVAKT
jgi:phosphate acetyltransferase